MESWAKMKIRRILQKFFRGYAVLEKVDSPINGKIQVREDWFGKRNLVVGGISQSGGNVEGIWKKVLRKLKNSKTKKLKNVLILGLGAGSAAKVIQKNFPRAKIVGIEIDPEMIRLGRKYFQLDRIKNLKIKPGDALSCFNDSNHQNSSELILVDLYIGSVVPLEAETEEFIKQVKQCLRPSGWVIFNRLYYGEKKEKTDKFGEKLRNFFSKIEAKKIASNKLFLCLNEAAN